MQVLQPLEQCQHLLGTEKSAQTLKKSVVRFKILGLVRSYRKLHTLSKCAKLRRIQMVSPWTVDLKFYWFH